VILDGICGFARSKLGPARHACEVREASPRRQGKEVSCGKGLHRQAVQ
jgi:hypothetical protein